MIKQPTRLHRKGTTTTSTLTDLLLTNRPDLFIRGRVFDPALSDHRLIYGIMWENAKKHSRKIINFRSYTNFDPVKYENLLIAAPWHVGNLFDDVDDQKEKRVSNKDITYMKTAWKNAIRAKRKAFKRYCKIPKISPGAYIFQRPLLSGLVLEGLIYGGKPAFQNRLGLYLEGNLRLKVDWASLQLEGHLYQ